VGKKCCLWHLRHIDIGLWFLLPYRFSFFLWTRLRKEREEETVNEERERERERESERNREKEQREGENREREIFREEIFAEPRRILCSFRWPYFIAI